MAIRLVTGVPGAGKSLYAVSKIVRPLVGTSIELENGKSANRRMVIGGVRDLLLDHEPLDVLTFDPESGRVGGEVLEDRERKPGDPPLEVPMRADNWWLWCQPGDYIVIDECQRLFRPMAAGRRIPRFISMLETHRHYGVDFLLITQHPMLLHASVRNLVGQHAHVRRMYGGAQTIVYEWDHCTNPDRVKHATKHIWRHDKEAFKLYKSAEVHTKNKHKLPFAAFVLAAGLIGTPLLGYTAYERLTTRWGGAEDATAQPGKATAVATAGVSASERPASAPMTSASASAMGPGAAASAPAVEPVEWAGCIQMGPRCECIDVKGMSRVVPLEFCTDTVKRSGVGAVGYQVLASTDGARVAPQATPAPPAAADGPAMVSLGGDPRAHVRE